MRQHRELSNINARILRFAKDDLARVMARVPAGDPKVARDLLLEVIPALIDRHTETAGEAAAQWYEREHERAFGSPGKGRMVGVDRDAVEGSVRWAVGPLFDGDSEHAQQRLATLVDRHVNNASRQTIVASALADNRSARWARVMSGAETCGWCRMLASRGFVYETRETAGADHAWGHDNCDCQIVPDFSLSDRELDAYNQRVDRLKAEYNDVISRIEGPVNANTVAKEWRKSLIDYDYEEKRLRKMRDRFTEDGSLNLETWDAYRRQLLERLRDEHPGGYTWGKYLPPRNPAPPPDDWPDDLPPMRHKEWNHILYGDANGGGHKFGYGWTDGGDEFNKAQDDEWIAATAEDMLRRHGPLDDRPVVIEQTVNGQAARLILGWRRGNPRVVTIFPVGRDQ